MLDKRDITVCTYFKNELTPQAGLTVFEGDNSLRGFFRALRAALVGRDYDVIHVHTPHAGALLLLGLLMFGLYRKFIPTTVHTVQNSFQNFPLRQKMLFLPSFPFYRRLVFCSKASYESFPSFYKWLGGNRMCIVPNGADLERIDRLVQAKPVSQSDQFTIASVGLIKIKNPFTVFEAFHQSSDEASRLVFMGEGNLRPLVAEEVQKAGLQNQVKTTGMIPRDSVFEYFTKADVFVSASWGEGLPVAVLEAMAASLPVILSDIPPHREVAEGVDFIPLLRPDDVAGFAREMKKFKAMPVSERIMIGKKCRKIIEERFSLRVMHAGYEKVYAEITGSQIPPVFEVAR
jgi:glycosyltransferase involved in cell wall biosynthesis